MAATIIGSPSPTASATNAKVLRRQQYQKDISGLETLTETYIVRTSNRIILSPAKDTKHSDFSTATTTFSRMSSESVSFNEQDGDLTEMNVTFVGLTSSSGLPPAIIRILPVTDAGIFGPDINIEAQFVTDSTETQLIGGQFSSTTPIIINPLSTSFKKMPSSINGTIFPKDPIAPFSKLGTGSSASYSRTYFGYVLNGINCDRRGQFLVATLTFAEKEQVLVSVSGGFSNRFGSPA